MSFGLPKTIPMKYKYKFSLRWLLKHGYNRSFLVVHSCDRWYDEDVWSSTVIPGLFWAYDL